MLTVSAAGAAKISKLSNDFRKMRSQSVESLTISYFYVEGIKRFNTGNMPAAEQFFQAILDNVPDHAPSLYQKARILMMTGGQLGALQSIEAAYQLDSLNTEYAKLYGQILFANNEVDKAQKLLDGFLVNRRHNLDNYIQAASLAQYHGKNEHALKLVNNYESVNGLDPQLGDIKREALIGLKRYAEAMAYTTNLQAAYPLDPHILVKLGELNASLHLDSLALFHYGKALDIDSSFIEAHVSLSEYYRIKENAPGYLTALLPIFESDQIEPANKAKYFTDQFLNPTFYRDNYPLIDKLAATMFLCHPGNAEVYDAYARFLMYVGRVDEAKQMFIDKVNNETATVDDYKYIIDISSYKGQLDSALLYTNQARDLYPTRSDFRLISSSILWQQKQIDRALEELKKALPYAESDSVRSGIYAFRGDIYYQMNDMKKCYSEYMKALKYNSENVMVLNNYAYYLSIEGRNLDQALDMSSRAVAQNSTNPTFIDTKAWVLHRMGRNIEALELMKQALAIDGHKNNELLLHYADIMYALGEDFMARSYWKKALEKGADATVIEERLSQPKATKTDVR